VRAWRELINCRSQVIAKRTRAKNTARALLRSAGVVPPKHPGLWTKKGLAWLRQLKLPTASQELRRDLLIEEIDTLIRQVRRIEQHLNKQAQQAPAVVRLRSIPGVGIRTAEAVAPSRHRAVLQPGGGTGFPPSVNFIDDEIFGKMQKDGVVPTVLAGDEEFLRRVTLDLTGRIPDPATVQSFLADSSGRRNAGRRRSARTSRGPSAATRSARRSPWWRPPITWSA